MSDQDFPLIITPEETKRRERGGTAVVERADTPPESGAVELAAPDEAPAPLEEEPAAEVLEAEPVDAPPEPASAELTVVRHAEPDPSALLKSVEALVQAHARLIRERDEARQRVAALEAQLKENGRAAELQARIDAALKALQA